MITPEAFNLKYNVFINPTIYADLVPLAIARAAIFPPLYRELAAEYYLGYLGCIATTDRKPSEIQKFEVKPEGYSVAYTNGEGRCDNWLNLLKQVALTAGIPWGARPATPIYADRTEPFKHSF